MGKKTEEPGLKSFLKSDFLSELQNQTQKGTTLIENYPLKAPFSYANILQDQESGSISYQVDETKLNQSEQIIYNQLYRLIEENLDSPENIEKDFGFMSFVNKILKDNEKLFQDYPLASMEKVKYYLERDIAGFGLIDSLMHDPNIEDVSCSGIDAPIYVWHRKYDSIPCNIKFEDKKLYEFMDRAIQHLKNNPTCGTHIKKRLWPKEYKRQYGITNLWKYDLPNAWRIIYTLKSDEVMILTVILEWFDHKEYAKLFKYH